MRAFAKGTLLIALVTVCCRPALGAKGPPILGAKPAHCAVKRSHYYVGPEWPGKGYGWAAKKALKWQGYGPLGTGAYRGFGYGFNGYPAPYRAYKFGYPQNVLGPTNVGSGYIYYTYFGEGYPGWKYWPGRNGSTW
jgi:hypothetical protein